MKTRWRAWPLIAAVAIVLGHAAIGRAEEEADKASKKEARSESKKEEKKETVTKPDPALDAWIGTLTEKMLDRHDGIRGSARAALLSVGKPALPALKKLAAGDDAAARVAAEHMLGRIEQHGMWRHHRGHHVVGHHHGRWGEASNHGWAGRRQYGRPGEHRRPEGPPPPRRPESGKRQPRAERQSGNEASEPAPAAADAKPTADAKPAPDAPPAGPRGQRGERGPNGLPLFFEAAIKDLKLTDTQREQVVKIATDHFKKAREQYEKNRENRPDREKMETLRKSLREDLQKQLKDVLTAEQLTAFEEAMKIAGPPRRPRPE